jgi:hypothetical protein
MSKVIYGSVRDPSKPMSLENIDFETSLYLRELRYGGIFYEFGVYNPKSGLVKITVDVYGDLDRRFTEKRKKIA